jgi:hypothetical protein
VLRKLLPSLFCLLAVAAIPALLPGGARAAQCGLPDAKPLWVDFSDGTVSFRDDVFGHPGVVVGTSGTAIPGELRAAGAQTIFWVMHLNSFVGTTAAPANPADIPARVGKLFDTAVASSGCSTPLIVLNELAGPGTITPWTPNNAQYRADVLALVQGLAARGAHPLLLLPSEPYTGGDAAAWWQQVASVADIVPEVYFNAPRVYKQGVTLGSRLMRATYRSAIKSFTDLGIPPSKLGLVIGFQSGSNTGGREGLNPSSSWFRFVKLQTLAAKTVAQELGLGSVLSWGWGTFSAAGQDPDKSAAACVYLWSRDQSLCDGPAAAGSGFNSSLTEGQIDLPTGVRCTLGTQVLTQAAIDRLAAVTGDPDLAYTILYERLVESQQANVTQQDVLNAERGIIAVHFGGSRAAYVAALGRAHASLDIARAAIGDELRRLKIEATLKAPAPTGSDIAAFYANYPTTPVRLVQVKPAPYWLGGKTKDYALGSLAPLQLFKLPTGQPANLLAATGIYQVTPLGNTKQLGVLPLSLVRSAIATTLASYARADAFETWSVLRQTRMLNLAVCLGDDFPDPGAFDVGSYLPYLEIS